MAKTTGRSNDTSANLGFEAKPWAAADALRNDMDAAEYNPSLEGVLPKDYARPGLDKQRLGRIINLVTSEERD